MAASSSLLTSSLPNISYLVSIKLDRTNYMLWLAQFNPLLKSNDLVAYVDGTKTCPTKFLENTTTLNSEYVTWQRQDQQLLSWINSTLTPNVLSIVATCDTSRAAWDTLKTRFASQSRTRVLQLKHQMQSTKRGNMSITDYVDKLTNFADQLALAGKPVDDDDLMELILNGVDPAFESIVTSVQARENPMSLDDMVALLLSAESRMDDYSPTFSPDHTTTALFAPSGSTPNPGRGTTLHRGNGRTSSFRRGGFQGRGFFQGRGASNPFVGRRGGSNSGLFHGGSGRGSFQNRGLLPTPNAGLRRSSYLPNHAADAPSSSNICNYCGDHRHSTANCFKSHFSEGRYPQSHAMMAASPVVNARSPTW